MSLNQKSRNTARILVVTTLALSQCWALSACGRKAALSGTKAASAAAAANAAKQNPAANPSPTPGTAPKSGTPPTISDTSSATSQSSAFAASLSSIGLTADTKGDAVLAKFEYNEANAAQSIGPIVAKLSAVTAATGADMQFPPGVTDFSAHLNCDKADCSTASLILTKLKAPLEGKATIRIESTASARTQVESNGTPVEGQAMVFTALSPQSNPVTQMNLFKISKGATFFKIESRVSEGTTSTDTSANTKGRTVTINGQLGDKTTVLISYSDSESAEPVSAALRMEDAKAVYSDADKTLSLTFEGKNQIKSMTFGPAARR